MNDDMAEIAAILKEILDLHMTLYKFNPTDLLQRFAAVNESWEFWKSWIHHYTPKTKPQSKQWKKAKSVLSVGSIHHIHPISASSQKFIVWEKIGNDSEVNAPTSVYFADLDGGIQTCKIVPC